MIQKTLEGTGIHSYDDENKDYLIFPFFLWRNTLVGQTSLSNSNTISNTKQKWQLHDKEGFLNHPNKNQNLRQTIIIGLNFRIIPLYHVVNHKMACGISKEKHNNNNITTLIRRFYAMIWRIKDKDTYVKLNNKDKQANDLSLLFCGLDQTGLNYGVYSRLISMI